MSVEGIGNNYLVCIDNENQVENESELKNVLKTRQQYYRRLICLVIERSWFKDQWDACGSCHFHGNNEEQLQRRGDSSQVFCINIEISQGIFLFLFFIFFAG